MKTTKLISIVTFALLIIACSSCSNSSQNKDEKNQTIAEKVINEQDVKPDIKKILYEFPTPFEVTVMLNKAKAAFIFDLTNPVDLVSKYETENSKAIFLGVYSADLSYAAAYNMAEEIEALLKCTSELTDKLGISNVYNEHLISDIKSNYNNQDSLVKIISTVFGDTKDLLSEANRDKTSFLIASGGFIETLYLAANLNALAENNSEISTIILNQKDNLDKLSSVISVLPEDEDTKKLNTGFTNLKSFYNTSNTEENSGLSKEESEKFKGIIEDIRTNL